MVLGKAGQTRTKQACARVILVARVVSRIYCTRDIMQLQSYEKIEL